MLFYNSEYIALARQNSGLAIGKPLADDRGAEGKCVEALFCSYPQACRTTLRESSICHDFSPICTRTCFGYFKVQAFLAWYSMNPKTFLQFLIDTYLNTLTKKGQISLFLTCPDMPFLIPIPNYLPWDVYGFGNYIIYCLSIK